MRMNVDYLIDHATLATMAGGDGPSRGRDQGRLGLIQDGALAVADGRIAAVGERADVVARVSAVDGIDLGGRLLMPGYVDAHTHLVWAGDRAAEFEQRIAGASYLEIMAAGGGIASTVRATRAASDAELLAGTLARQDELLDHGATTVEAKTGYGLSTEEELRHLRILAEADRRHPVRVVPTFLGAHAVPEEYRGRQEAYVELVVEDMLPRVAEAWPGVFCDVFCDDRAFTADQTALILGRAHALGLRLKVHADEFANLGCAGRAAELGAVSADHLVATPPAEMDAMAAAGTVAVLLPGTTLGLGSAHFAPAREMVGRGVAVALGTDLNPGTCPCTNLTLMLALAARYLRLTPAEALVAATRNAAYATGVGQGAGRLEAGRAADLVAMDTDDYRALAYAFGGNPVAGVMVGGSWVRPVR